MTTTQNADPIAFADQADKDAELDRLDTLIAEFTAKGDTKIATLARERRVLVGMTTPDNQDRTYANIVDLTY